MKKFKFRLQKVLELKQHFERKKQQELAILLQKMQLEKQLLLKLMQEQESYRHQRLKVEAGGNTLLDVVIIDRYLRHLRESIKQQRRVIEQLRYAISQKQYELREAMKERKIFENYREKKQGEHQKMVLEFEQNFLDEITNGRTARKYGS